MRRPKELPRRQKIQSATMSTDAADRLVGTIVERLRQLQGDGADATSATLKEIFKTSRPAIIADRLMKAAGDLAQGNEGALQVKLSELALEIRRKVIGPKTLSAAKSLDLLVDAMSRTKQFGAAIPLCTEALQIREAILGKRHWEVAQNLCRLGELEYQQGNYHAAKSSLARALAVQRRVLVLNDPMFAESLTSLARAEISLGNFAAAIPHCEEALRIKSAERGEQNPELAILLINLAAACQWSGRVQDAFVASERSVSIVKVNFGAEDRRLTEPLCNLSQAALSLGRFHDAYAAAERALAIQTHAVGEFDPGTAHATATLASVLLEIGELHRSQDLFERTLTILRELDDHPRETVQTLVNLGLVHAKLGKYEVAREQLEQALSLFHADGAGVSLGSIVENLAVVNSRLGDRTTALRLHQQALQVERRRLGETSENVGLNLLAIGMLRYSQEQEVLGLENLMQGMTILLNSDDPNYLAEGYRALAEILGRGYKSVEIFFEKLAINVLQSMRRGIGTFDAALERTFISTRESAYRSLGDSLVLDGRLPEAQQIIAMIKEQELFQLTRGSAEIRRTQASLTPFEEMWRQRINDVRNKIKAACDVTKRDRNRVSKRIESKKLREIVIHASAELRSCLQGLAADFERINTIVDEQTPPAREPTNSMTGMKPAPGVAIIHYLLAPKDLRIILTTSDVQRDYHVGLAQGEINRLVYAMREAMQDRSEQFLPPAQRLYDIVMAPLASDLAAARVSTLMLSLDGVLRYLPMAALHDGTRYLVEHFAVLIVTGTVGLSAATGGTVIRGAGLGTTQAFGNLGPLVGVREELAAVIRTSDEGEGIVPGSIRFDADFTADALREVASAGNAVVHIASHFVFAVAQDASSYLQLGDGSRLTLSELARIQFDGVELVALSACDTAVAAGHHQSGREMEGLGAMVRGQGARNVVATLWPVADRMTAALMRAFYQNRYEHALPLAEALQRAQLSCLRGEIDFYPRLSMRGLIDPDDDSVADHHRAGADHPFYWAPYVLMGETIEPTPL